MNSPQLNQTGATIWNKEGISGAVGVQPLTDCYWCSALIHIRTVIAFILVSRIYDQRLCSPSESMNITPCYINTISV